MQISAKFTRQVSPTHAPHHFAMELGHLYAQYNHDELKPKKIQYSNGKNSHRICSEGKEKLSYLKRGNAEAVEGAQGGGVKAVFGFACTRQPVE